MTKTRIVENGGRFDVVSLDGKKVYGSYHSRERAEMRQRHIHNSSLPRRDRISESGCRVAKRDNGWKPRS